MTDQRALERNVERYPAYAAAQSAYFWMPVFFLYFAQRVGLREVLALEAIYYASVVLLEVPSGYFSDRVGRRATLLISAASLLAAHLLFVLADGFATLALAQVLLAAGIAFNSGTDTSFHLDSLASLERADEYGDREARVARLSFWSSAVAAALGGALAMLSLRAAYGLSALAALAAFVLAWRFVEPIAHTSTAPISSFGAQLAECLRLARTRALAWPFAAAVLCVVVNHLPYELYQPYLAQVGARLGTASETTPLATGLHATVTLVLAGFAAGYSMRLRRRVGLRMLVVSSLALQGALVLAMGLWLHPVVAALVVLRGLGRALQQAPLNDAVAPQLPSTLRATYLSLQSLAGRCAFALVLLGGAALAGSASPDDALAHLAQSASVLVALIVAALALWPAPERAGGVEPGGRG